jgi:phage terminase large subunit-like protein
VLTPGRTTDYDFIQVQLEADWQRFDIKEIAYDSYNASQFITNLIKLGWEDHIFEFGQGWKLISPASKDFEKKLLSKEIESHPNPVVAWQVGNCEITIGPEGNIRPAKSKNRTTKKHIDCVVSMIMALDRCTRNVNAESIYETEGIKSFG